MEKCIFLLLVVVVVVSQAQSQKPSGSGRLQQSGRRPSGRSGRPSQGGVLSKPASPTTRKSPGAKLTAKLSTAPGTKRPLGANLKAGKAQVTTKPAPSRSPKTKCKGRCKFPNEVCVRKARCMGPSCFFCAETNSIPKLPGKKPTPTPTINMSPGFNSMAMDNMGMYSMPQQQPTDIFSELFGLGPSTGGFDIFGTHQQQVVKQPVSSGFPNSFYPTNPLTSIPVAAGSPFNQMDYSQSFSGNSQSAAGPMTNSNSDPFLHGSSQMASPMLPPYNLMRESPTMDRTSGLANLFGGLFGGGGSGGMSGGSGMNLLSMSMLGIDPFQLF